MGFQLFLLFVDQFFMALYTNIFTAVLDTPLPVNLWISHFGSFTSDVLVTLVTTDLAKFILIRWEFVLTGKFMVSGTVALVFVGFVSTALHMFGSFDPVEFPRILFVAQDKQQEILLCEYFSILALGLENGLPIQILL